jgi:CheY-like chemotaxis protein
MATGQAHKNKSVACEADNSGVILVVDDDEGLRETIAEVLADDGYAVVTASNGAEAIALLSVLRPAFMLLDLMMPVVNGWQVVEWLKANAARAVRYCIMTAVPAHAPEGEAYVLAKPMQLESLLEVVNQHAPR